MRVGSWPGSDFQHNPFIARLCGALRTQGVQIVDVADPRRVSARDIDILHLHWPEQVFWAGGSSWRKAARLATTVAALAMLRARGVKLVWTVHNLQPHQPGAGETLLWPFARRSFVALAHRLVTLSDATKPLVAAAFKVPVQLLEAVRLPAYGSGPHRDQARRALGYGPDIRLLVFFGEVRQNKGVESLLSAFRASPDQTLRLHVVGYSPTPQRYHDLAGGDPRITMTLSYTPLADLEIKVSAADLAIIPLTGQLHSSSILHSISLGTPVLTSASPFAEGMAVDVGPGWVNLYKGELRPEMFDLSGPTAPPDLSLYQPDVVARAMESIYEDVSKRA